MNNFEWQRFVFRKAVKNGWKGEKPSDTRYDYSGVLGTHEADAAFLSAEKFLIEKGMILDRPVNKEN